MSMRISELSRQSGVPVATIKYYLREGLVPPGTPTARNQADYGEEHLRRLRLVRVLADVGGLGIAAIRDVLAAIGDESMPLHDVLGVAQYALGPPPDAAPPAPDVLAARADVDAWLRAMTWQVSPESPSRRALADVLVGVRRLGLPAGPEIFAPYAGVADELARGEVAALPADGPAAETVEWQVVGTVVFEAAFAALRRMAQERHSATRFRRTRRG